MNSYAGLTASGHPFVRIGDGGLPLVVFGGVESRHVVPQGLHLQGIADTFKPVAKEREVIVLKRPDSTAPGMTHEGMADAYARAVTELTGGSPVAVMGTAAGGTIAQIFATKYQVPALALISTATRMSDSGRALYSEAISLTKARRYRALNSLLIRHLYPSAMASRLYGGIAYLFPELSSEDDHRELLAELQAAQEADTGKYSKNISPQTLILIGRHDQLYSAHDAQALSLAIPNAELSVFENHGHGLPRTQSEELIRTVRDFVSAVAPG